MIKPFTIYDGYEDIVPTWDDIKDMIEAPSGKVYAGVEINGKKFNIGDTFKVEEDIVIKILWDDNNNNENNNNTENNTETNINNETTNPENTSTTTTKNPKIGDNVIFWISILAISIIGIIGTLKYTRKKD